VRGIQSGSSKGVSVIVKPLQKKPDDSATPSAGKAGGRGEDARCGRAEARAGACARSPGRDHPTGGGQPGESASTCPGVASEH
jgi:hypothetical protein